jgi:hypothetical protein
MVDFTIAALGNTTNPPTVPVNGAFAPATSTFPLRANGIDTTTAGAPTRTGTGVYVITYSHLLPSVFFASACVVKAGSSPTAVLVADVTIIDPANRQLTVKVAVPNGTLTDLGVNDMLLIYVQAQDSGV